MVEKRNGTELEGVCDGGEGRKQMGMKDELIRR